MAHSSHSQQVSNQHISKYMSKPDVCQLCGRNVFLTFHHLIPRKVHRRPRFKKQCSREELNRGIWICRKCHKGIHKSFDEMTLAKELFTLEKLQANSVIAKHVQWVSKQKA